MAHFLSRTKSTQQTSRAMNLSRDGSVFRNFLAELRRIPLPRTPVNRRGGASPQEIHRKFIALITLVSNRRGEEPFHEVRFFVT